MTAPHGSGPPRSSVADVMAAIKATYAAVNDPTTFYVGERFLRQHGSPPRIVLVRSGGKAVPGVRQGDGNVSGFAQRFTAYLWGSEDVDDVKRYAKVDAMLDRYINAVRALIPGRCEISTVDPLVETNVVTFGEELQVVVTWTRSVPRDAAVWAVPQTPVSPPDPARPQGDTGKTFHVTVDAETNASR